MEGSRTDPDRQHVAALLGGVRPRDVSGDPLVAGKPDDGDAFLDERTYAEPIPAGPMAPPVQNEDQAIITRWERDVRARGNMAHATLR